MNIIDDETNILCERCQETIQFCIDGLVLDMDLLCHEICFDEHVDEHLKLWESLLIKTQKNP